MGLMPKSHAATAPVQAPVAGSGIAMKIMRAIAPYFSCEVTNFERVRANSHVKNLSKSLKRFRRKFEIGSRSKSIGKIGNMFPITLNRYAFGILMPYTVSATGSAPRNSNTGVAAKASVKSS